MSEYSGSFSSRDRSARYNSITQRYENWYSNDDGTRFLRQENEDLVVAEMKGSGVIWRI